MYICVKKETCLAGWHHWQAFWQFAAAFINAGMQCLTVCACRCVTDDDDVWLIKNRMKLKLSNMHVDIFQFHCKSL